MLRKEPLEDRAVDDLVPALDAGVHNGRVPHRLGIDLALCSGVLAALAVGVAEVVRAQVLARDWGHRVDGDIKTVASEIIVLVVAPSLAP